MDRKSQLKNLMKKERQDRTQKVDSPLAKYNSAGQLLCILCQTPVQPDSQWEAHCKTKKHLENLLALKQAKAAKSTAVKRTAAEVPNEDEQPAKRAKVTPVSQQTPPVPAPVAAEAEPTALVTYDEGASDASDEETGLDAETVAQLEREMMSEDEINKLIAQTRVKQEPAAEVEVEVNLPSGFFDAKNAERAVKTVKQAPPSTQSATEGDEWDKFQASIQQTEDVSTVPQELEDDTLDTLDTLDTRLDDIDTRGSDLNTELEQQSLLTRLLEIKKKAAEQLAQPVKSAPKPVDTSDEEDDADPFDWRAKGF